MKQDNNSHHIVIVGGGTAGWLSAAFLSSQLKNRFQKNVNITLVEASDIATIGVGEATIPSLRQTLSACGIDEREFLKACDATFKHGIEFIQWRETPAKAPAESYFHPFGELVSVEGHNPAHQWSKLGKDQREGFADLFSVQPEIAKLGRAPKHSNDRAYDGALAYAYHLDAGKLVEFLKAKFRDVSVKQIIGKVVGASSSENGNFSSVQLDDGRSIEGDFFIDCTGFAARLINADQENEFIDKSSILFVNRAVTTRIPVEDKRDITGYTKCTAQTAGWIWDIALQTRRGIGHVFSTRHMNDEDAVQCLANYTGKPIEDLDVRFLDMKTGYHAHQWRKNCVAVGLSSGFLEPLESTGIYLIEMANWALLDMLPRFFSGAQPQERYNEAMRLHYENIVDFLKLHYCLSNRDDSDFWTENRGPQTVPETLKQKLHQWQNSVPSVYDFDRRIQCFSENNYQFVLYGMGWSGHDCVQPLNNDIQQMLDALAVRRERLRQFVLRDTQANLDFY